MCGKTGVRWIVYLSDGSRVGGECAKKIMGWAPTKKTHGWVQGLTAVAEKEVAGPVGRTQAVLYRSASGKSGAMSVGGVRVVAGPFEWVEREYAAEW